VGAPEGASGGGANIVAATPTRIFVWGGELGENSGTLATQAGLYDVAGNAWAPVDNGAEPTARTNHTVTVDGSIVTVWGGRNGARALNTGGRYNLATDTWTPTNSVGAPSARFDHTAFEHWDIITIWGGVSEAGGVTTYYGDGARYDPNADSWQPVSMVNAPSPRRYHVALGGMVWGGADENGQLGDGALYDSDLDVWTPVSASPLAARELHTLVTDEVGFYMWGGRSGSPGSYTYYGDGAMYDPGGDTWTLMNMTDAPSARAGHAAAFSGQYMVIWGGSTDPGGLYDVGANSWQVMNMTGAPVNRDGASLIAMNMNQMMAIGGESDGSTGAIFEASQNIWAPIAPLPANLSAGKAVFVGASNQVVVAGNGTALVYDPWYIPSIYFACGCYSGNTEIRIFGVGFGASQGTSTAVINGIPLTSVLVWDDEDVYFSKPPGLPSGYYDLTLTIGTYSVTFNTQIP
jgi:hypothetical protein